MTETEFQSQLGALQNCTFIEDYGRVLHAMFANCDGVQRVTLRELIRSSQIRKPETWRNPMDYQRSDLTRQEKVEEILFVLAMYGARGEDFRHDLMQLGFAYCGAAVLGLDPDQLFERYAAMCEPSEADLLRKFIARPAADKTLKAWGLRLVETADGPWIERTT